MPLGETRKRDEKPLLAERPPCFAVHNKNLESFLEEIRCSGFRAE
jgi:hypothetical protein